MCVCGIRNAYHFLFFSSPFFPFFNFSSNIWQAQIVLLFILIIAQFAFVIGSFMGPSDETEIAKGFVGYSSNSVYILFICVVLLLFFYVGKIVSNLVHFHKVTFEI